MVLGEDVLRNVMQHKSRTCHFEKIMLSVLDYVPPYRVATSLLRHCTERYRVAAVRFEKRYVMWSFRLLAGKSHVNRDTRLTDWPCLNIDPLARATLNVTAFIAFAMFDVTIQNREHMHAHLVYRALDFYSS